MNVVRHRIGAALYYLSWLIADVAAWVEVWRCEECGAYSRDPIGVDSFHNICPVCRKLAGV